MKKAFLIFLVASFIISCNPNPQATGDSIIMKQEKQANAIEYQTDSITAAPQGSFSSSDTSASKNTGDTVTPKK